MRFKCSKEVYGFFIESFIEKMHIICSLKVSEHWKNRKVPKQLNHRRAISCHSGQRIRDLLLDNEHRSKDLFACPCVIGTCPYSVTFASPPLSSFLTKLKSYHAILCHFFLSLLFYNNQANQLSNMTPGNRVRGRRLHKKAFN